MVDLKYYFVTKSAHSNLKFINFPFKAISIVNHYCKKKVHQQNPTSFTENQVIIGENKNFVIKLVEILNSFSKK